MAGLIFHHGLTTVYMVGYMLLGGIGVILMVFFPSLIWQIFACVGTATFALLVELAFIDFNMDKYKAKYKELGTWEKTNETMSDASRDYQKYITGAEDGMVYKVNGVKFDGYKIGVLIEAKGNYSNFVNKSTGEFHNWFKGQDSLISQANRQLKAAKGARVQGYFNDEISMNAVKELFLKENISGIEFILKPIK